MYVTGELDNEQDPIAVVLSHVSQAFELQDAFCERRWPQKQSALLNVVLAMNAITTGVLPHILLTVTAAPLLSTVEVKAAQHALCFESGARSLAQRSARLCQAPANGV